MRKGHGNTQFGLTPIWNLRYWNFQLPNTDLGHGDAHIEILRCGTVQCGVLQCGNLSWGILQCEIPHCGILQGPRYGFVIRTHTFLSRACGDLTMRVRNLSMWNLTM